MSRPLTPLHSINQIGFIRPGFVQDHLRIRRCHTLVLAADHVGGGDVAPGCIGGFGPEDAERLGLDEGGVVRGDSGGEVAVEGGDGEVGGDGIGVCLGVLVVR